jgi:8-oxo-dGTP pyrophosphatase MutT (NUDIX family)
MTNLERPKTIRVIALGLITHQDRLFVYESYDPEKQTLFYRALGGGVEFGESSLEALHREFQEEIQAELTQVRYLTCIENRFLYCGRPHHEIVQLYQCDFVDPKFYALEQLTFCDGHAEPILAKWVACDRFRSGELTLVPPACLDYI